MEERSKKGRSAESTWVERSIEVEPQPVSKSFIDGLQAAGARESLVEALREEHAQKKSKAT